MKKRKNHSPECKASVAPEAIWQETTPVELSKRYASTRPGSARGSVQRQREHRDGICAWRRDALLRILKILYQPQGVVDGCMGIAGRDRITNAEQLEAAIVVTSDALRRAGDQRIIVHLPQI